MDPSKGELQALSNDLCAWSASALSMLTTMLWLKWNNEKTPGQKRSTSDALGNRASRWDLLHFSG